MARASSPLSQRLKALAVRAGLPVDTGPAPASAAPADDEQPTGEFPAVASSDTPDDDRPTGEFPAVSESSTEPQLGTTEAAPGPTQSDPTESEPHAEANSAASSEPASPAASDESQAGEPPTAPAVPDPIWGHTPAAVPPPVREVPAPAPPAPIWTDAPPESQAPQTTETDALDESVAAGSPSAPDGPTLPPPVLSKPAQLDEALSLEDESRVAGDGDSELAASVAPGEAAPASADVPPDDQPTVVQPSVDAGDDAPTTSFLAEVPAPTPAQGPEIESADPTPAPADDAASAVAAEPEESEELPPPEKPSKDRLSLTGRFAALRRRATTGRDSSDTESTPSGDETPAPSPDGAEADPSAAAATPTPAPANLGPVIVDAHSHAKPSFSERAALRRRVKTLRARRDTGLLELGAIVLDQRRFGDPTAGALLRRRTDELGDLDNEIAEIERALDEHASAAAVAALGAVRCVGCSSLVGPTERYCAHCGTPRPVGGAAGESAADPRS